MTRQILRIVTSFVLPAIMGLTAPAIAQQSVAINRGVVELETAGTAGISVRIGEELANLIDDGATRRLVPVVGKSALQTCSISNISAASIWRFFRSTCSIMQGNRS